MDSDLKSGDYENGNGTKVDERMSDEHQYLDLIRHILANGRKRTDRTGVGTLSVFGTQSRYSLNDDTFPLLTTKRVFHRGIVEELLWFIRGSTDSKELAAKNVHIWDANGSKEFLAKCGLAHRDEGDLGPVYGFQWRHCGAKYTTAGDDYRGKGVDQLKQCVEQIKNQSDSRRIIMCAWNPCDLPEMALPPCHCLVQFYVNDGELSSQLYQRSGDVGLGVPFNIASYALLTHMMAHVCDLKAGDFVHTIGDTHIYLNHVDALKEQITRTPRPFPKIRWKRRVTDIEDFGSDDFELIGYNPHPKIQMEMAV